MQKAGNGEGGERATVRKVRGSSEVPWLQGAAQSLHQYKDVCNNVCTLGSRSSKEFWGFKIMPE